MEDLQGVASVHAFESGLGFVPRRRGSRLVMVAPGSPRWASAARLLNQDADRIALPRGAAGIVETYAGFEMAERDIDTRAGYSH